MVMLRLPSGDIIVSMDDTGAITSAPSAPPVVQDPYWSTHIFPSKFSHKFEISPILEVFFDLSTRFAGTVHVGIL